MFHQEKGVSWNVALNNDRLMTQPMFEKKARRESGLSSLTLNVYKR